MVHSRMRRAAALLLLTGCAAYANAERLLAPGVNVGDREVSTYCESPEVYRQHLEHARTLEAYERRPRVGMTSCEVIARIGKPHEVRIVETTSGPAELHWTYWSNDETRAHLIVLEPGQDGRGSVRSVVW